MGWEVQEATAAEALAMAGTAIPAMCLGATAATGASQLARSRAAMAMHFGVMAATGASQPAHPWGAVARGDTSAPASGAPPLAHLHQALKHQPCPGAPVPLPSPAQLSRTKTDNMQVRVAAAASAGCCTSCMYVRPLKCLLRLRFVPVFAQRLCSVGFACRADAEALMPLR